MEWQPIETAPTDGARVLVWDGSLKMAFACAYENGLWQTGVWTGRRPQITHWMPLPPPPIVRSALKSA